MRKGLLLDWLLPGVLLFLLTALLVWCDLDLYIELFFYDPLDGWIWESAGWIRFYYYGVPVIMIGIAVGALLAFAGSFFIGSWRACRASALFLVLLMLLGPGLIVNWGLKDSWGRPRPRQVVLLGGTEAFRTVLQKGCNGCGRSFPCGHCSASFYLIAPYFIWRRKSAATAAAWLVFGLGHGLVMGVARMAAGGHFASDVLWAAAIVYFCGLGLEYLVLEPVK